MYRKEKSTVYYIYVTLREESREVYVMAINRKRKLNVSCFFSLCFAGERKLGCRKAIKRVGGYYLNTKGER
jgi:hypothetical protein